MNQIDVLNNYTEITESKLDDCKFAIFFNLQNLIHDAQEAMELVRDSHRLRPHLLTDFSSSLTPQIVRYNEYLSDLALLKHLSSLPANGTK